MSYMKNYKSFWLITTITIYLYTCFLAWDFTWIKNIREWHIMERFFLAIMIVIKEILTYQFYKLYIEKHTPEK